MLRSPIIAGPPSHPAAPAIEPVDPQQTRQLRDHRRRFTALIGFHRKHAMRFFGRTDPNGDLARDPGARPTTLLHGRR
jgi:hypothetical protein